MKFCVVCQSPVQDFLPYKGGWAAVSPLLRALQVVGSDVDHFHCPRCGSHDRERHLFLRFLQRPALLEGLRGARVLHIAPERYLQALIESRAPACYVRGDLRPRQEGVVPLDIERIDAPDASFDLVIANHVLEHVADDAAALREVHRVLAPGGHALLQTPFSAVLDSTVCEQGEGSPQTREMLFGEPDHLRLYGRHLIRRIEDAGFEHLGAQDLPPGTPAADPVRFGFNPDEPLFLFRKRS